MNSATVRKRLTARNSPPARSSTNKFVLPLEDNRNFKQLELVADPKSKTGCKSKIYPKTLSAEGFRYSRPVSFDRKSSSQDSSDTEFDIAANNQYKRFEYKNEEKSQLICYKDNVKIVAIKNDSKLTKYNTFDMKVNEKRGRIVKYKSLDEPESKTLVKYLDPQSKISISAQDFTCDFKMSKFDRKKSRHDIITDTVDAWSKKSSKNVFSNIRNSIFKSSTPDKEVVFKPLVFGGTFPIDRPEMRLEKSFEREKERFNSRVIMNQSPKVREYGPAKTFDIDQPI